MKRINADKALSSLTKPQHPVLLVSGSRDEKINFMAAGWVMRTSLDPPLMAVSVGHGRYTYALMKKYPEFVLSYPAEGQEKLIELGGSFSGRETDKFSKTDEPLEEGKEVKLPIFKGARVNFECRKVDAFKTGDHTIFIGRVASASGNPDLNPLINIGNYTYREFKL